MEELLKNIEEKKIVLLGFGKEGKSTYHFIRKHFPEKSLTVIDENIDINSEDNKFIFEDVNLELWKTSDYFKLLDDFDIIFKSPGISFKGKDISKFRNKLTSQLEVLLKYIDTYSIGITGTKGKSTTTTLIYNILKDQEKNVKICGNIGVPPLDEIDEIIAADYIVIEMSSHQLEYMDVSPNISIILNMFEEHLDHYNSYDDYCLAKLNIAKYQTEKDFFIYNKDNDKTVEMVSKVDIKSKKITISSSNKVSFNFEAERKLLGKHNEYNIMFALAVSELLKLDMDKVTKTILGFEGLEHRMEYVTEINGVKYYNDSISTIPEATMRAIETFKNTGTIIIGGMDRGVHYKSLIDYLKTSTVDNIICMYDTGKKIYDELINIVENKNIVYVDGLKEAVEKAKELSKPGTVCILSPAAASYGVFKNFEERGRLYKEYVKM